MQRRQHLAALFQQQRLGDLELQPLRRQAGLLQRIHHQRQQIADAELQRRQIDRDAHVIGPLRRIRAGATQHQAADRVDQAGLFRNGNELGRRDHAALGMRPAHQRLEAGDAPGRKIDQRLVVRPQHIVAGSPRAVRFRSCGGSGRARPSRPRRRRTCRGNRSWRATAPCRRSSAASRNRRRRRATSQCRCWRRPRRNGRPEDRARRSLPADACARNTASSGRVTPLWMIANSSEFSRASASSSRSVERKRLATPRSSLSPMPWPSVSLTALKLSRPSTSTATFSALRRVCSRMSSICWRSKLRFGSPVSPSCWAMKVSRASARLRSVMSISASSIAGWSP